MAISTNPTPPPSDAIAYLLPCPFCGGEHLECQYVPRSSNPDITHWLAECKGCGARGPIVPRPIHGVAFSDATDPLAAWNSRAREIAAQPGEGDAISAVADWLEYKADFVGGIAFSLEMKNKAKMLRAASPPHVADALDGERLDWLNQRGESYGFENEHLGNRWMIELDGPFNTIREAIDAAIAARAEAGGES